MNTWKPADEVLHRISQLLREALNPTNSLFVQQELNNFNTIPEFDSYLAHIMTQKNSYDMDIRSVAGLRLKRNIENRRGKMPTEVLEHVKECCLMNIGDPEASKQIGYVATAILKYGSVQQWPQLLLVLVEKLDDPSAVVVENAFRTLHAVCEDCGEDLDRPINGESPLEFMVPKFLMYFNHHNPAIRHFAISSTTKLILPVARSADPNRQPLMVRFLEALFGRAEDENMEVRKDVCRALASILEVCPERLFPSMPNLVDYILFCTQSEDEELALEACEFWLVCAESTGTNERGSAREPEELYFYEQLLPFLSKIVPVLLNSMVYSDMDLVTLGGDEDDAHIADNAQDIKPRFYKANTVENARKNKHDVDEGGSKKATPQQDEDDNDDENEDDDDDDDDDDDEDDGAYDEWNLRKCSAATLDILCRSYGIEIISLLIPLLDVELKHEDWKHVECGILALGAASAEDDQDPIAPYLPGLIPYLLEKLSHPKPLIRSITCWTLSRYARWIVDPTYSFLPPTIEKLLERILDNNKRVQEAACSAFSILEEEACDELVPYIPRIVDTLSRAVAKFQRGNRRQIYDTIGTLADIVPEALRNDETLSRIFIETIMPPLMKNWQNTQDDDIDFFGLQECLSSIAPALGRKFKPFAEPVYNRSVSLVYSTLHQCEQAAQGTGVDEPDKDVIVVSLDVLSAVVQALNTDADAYVSKTNPPIIQLLSVCIQDPVHEVRQSAYALLGDLTISCFNHIRSYVPQLMEVLITQVDPHMKYVSVCNNATWAAGEIAIKCGPDFKPYIAPLLERLLPMINNDDCPRTLKENVAITIGRLGSCDPHGLAHHLEVFVDPFLNALNEIRDNDEKSSAFMGLCVVIGAHPQGCLMHLPNLVRSIALYQNPPQQLAASLRQILVGYKQMAAPMFNEIVAALSSEEAESLSRYELNTLG